MECDCHRPVGWIMPVSAVDCGVEHHAITYALLSTQIAKSMTSRNGVIRVLIGLSKLPHRFRLHPTRRYGRMPITLPSSAPDPPFRLPLIPNKQRFSY